MKAAGTDEIGELLAVGRAALVERSCDRGDLAVEVLLSGRTRRLAVPTMPGE